jgi:putative tricarboxylic transport membrane protein
MPPALRRAAAPLGGLVAAVILLVHAQGLDGAAREGQLGPGFWPRLVLGGLGLACLAHLVTARRRGGEPLAPAPAPDAEPGPIDWRRLAAGILLVVAYVIGATWLGFAIATAAFIAAFMRLGGARSAAGIAATALLGTAALLYVFVRVVYLPLPKGSGPLEDVTVALYRALGIF